MCCCVLQHTFGYYYNWNEDIHMPAIENFMSRSKRIKKAATGDAKFSSAAHREKV